MGLNVGELFATISVRNRSRPEIKQFTNDLDDAAKKSQTSFGSVAANAAAMSARLTAMALAGSVAAAGLASAAQGGVALAAALAPAVGIVSALPGALALGVAGLSTLKVALSGVAENFAAAMSGDMERWAAVGEKISSVASSVAFELFQMSPAFQGLKEDVQDAFFLPLVDQMWSLLPAINAVTSGMVGVAGVFGQAALTLVSFVRESATIQAITAIFGATQRAIASLLPALRPLLAGFRDLAVVGANFSAGLAPGIAAAATRFGEFLSRAAESGQALGWMQGAVEVFRQLGTVGGSIVGIVRSVFGAMQTGGTNALGVLGQILGKLNEFLASAEGQRILVTIFQSLSQVGNALMPIFVALGGAVAQIAPHIANIAVALGPGLAAAVSALGPALAALGPGLTVVAEMLAKAFASPELQAGLLALGQGLSAALAAVAPLLPVVAQLAGIVGQVLGIALTNLSAVLGPVIMALADALQPALVGVSSALYQLGPVMAPVYASFGQIAAAVVTQVLPPFLQLIPSLLNGLVPAFVELARAMLPVLPILTDLAIMVIQQVLPALIPILPWLTKIGVGFAQLGVKVAEIVTQLKPLIEKGVAIFQWMYDVLVGHSIVPDMVDAIGRWIGTTLVGWFRDLPGRIKSAVSNIGSTMGSIAEDVVSGFWNRLQSLAGDLYNKISNFFSNIVESAKNALGIHSPSRVFAWVGSMIPAGMAKGITQGAGLVTSSLRKVAAMAASTAMPTLSPGIDVPGGLAGGAAGGRTVIHQTNYYPQAEPTSTSVNRGLQLAGALGVI
ncbi:hypothetical protein AB0L65_20585 [Nonomuraea sp. NPDC052116]|uniref:phage tail protein n=1 Tax=Nonomuraea sp. NPDC052116 TaxID=3155665 RepID=UPI00342FACD5